MRSALRTQPGASDDIAARGQQVSLSLVNILPRLIRAAASRVVLTRRCCWLPAGAEAKQLPVGPAAAERAARV